MLKIAIIGTGYVGLVSGVCLASLGHQVRCIDTHANVIENLKIGKIHIHELGLTELLHNNQDNIKFTGNFDDLAQHEMIIIAVGTPSRDDGSVDMSYFDAVIEQIEAQCKGQTSAGEQRIIAIKSTVPAGTAIKLQQRLGDGYHVVSNPEFLREGTAVKDFLAPERIVFGLANPNHLEPDLEKKLYRLYLQIIEGGTKVIFTDNTSAELAKYAANSFLATKVAFINEIAQIAKKYDANINDIAAVMGSDTRIGPLFLKPGPGYGGACFPKDTKALEHIARIVGANSDVVSGTIAANDSHKVSLANEVIEYLKQYHKLTDTSSRVGILGATFKANTDDIRDSATLTIIDVLLQNNYNIAIHDPQGLKQLAQAYSAAINDGRITLAASPIEAASGSIAMIIMTEWEQYKYENTDYNKLKQAMNGDLLFDYRNLLPRSEIQTIGYKYISLDYKPQ